MSYRPVTLGQVTQVRKMAIEKGVPRGPFQTALDDGRFALFLDSLKPLEGDLARWSENYFKLFGQRPDLSRVRVPEKPEGFGPMRLIVVVRELVEWTGNRPLQGVQNALEKHFHCSQYDRDLDVAIPANDRDPRNGSYAVWVRDVREADEEFVNKSANDLKAEGHTGITMLERQLLEEDYFFEKGEHLDVTNLTLCTGSRYSGGSVPSAHWYDKFNAYWYYSSYRYPHLRSRRVWA